MDARYIFDRFAEQIDASVSEFNSQRAGHDLHCERTPDRVAVYNAQVTMELEFDEVAGTVRMRRQKLGQIVTDLRYAVDPKNRVYLERTDYGRLARQALHPLIYGFR